MNNNIKLPKNFSDEVMKAINKQITAREARQEWVMYSIIIAVAVLFGVGLVLVSIYYGWFADVAKSFDLMALRELLSDSTAIPWIIISANAAVLLALYSYLSRRLMEKNREIV